MLLFQNFFENFFRNIVGIYLVEPFKITFLSVVSPYSTIEYKAAY